MKTYRIGLIGAGARGETFAMQLHKGSPRATLFGVCDIDEDRLAKFCDYCELGGARRSADINAFVGEPQLDAVIITVPEFAHRDVAVAAMKAGKHVYIEKPLAHTLEDCRAIIEAAHSTGAVAFVGFNQRANALCRKLREIVRSGVLGQLIYISGLEQLAREHGASFMRRFHRLSKHTGGMLNHKCSHDIDIMLWTIGHEHRVARVVSFGGTNVFTPDRAPAKFCHECPREVWEKCPYKFQPGYVFPITSKQPLSHRKSETYGGDLCAFNADKDIVDNQTVIMEFENGVRGDFRLLMFQAKHRRCLTVWGEQGFVELDTGRTPSLRVVKSDGEIIEHTEPPVTAGHGGTDAQMITQFAEAIDRGQADSGLMAGLAAAIVALKADESRLQRRVVEIAPEEYL